MSKRSVYEDFQTKCYFVLKGCVRQYSIDEAGKEITSNFYTEEQAISNFNHHRQDKSSTCSLICLENCVLVVGDLGFEKDMYNKYSQLETMTRTMIELNFGEVQDELASFLASTPEGRYKALLRKRPYLVDRVPQHQLASYLGITPESLSRCYTFPPLNSSQMPKPNSPRNIGILNPISRIEINASYCEKIVFNTLITI